MIRKSLFVAGFVSASTLAFAGPKSYSVYFDQPASVGSLKLAPGEYKLKLENGIATFTNVRTSQSVTAQAKLATADKKFATTAVDAVIDGKTERVSAIQLGGSTTKVEFPAGSAAQNGM